MFCYLTFDHTRLKLMKNERMVWCPEYAHKGSEGHSLGLPINLGTLTNQISATVTNTDKNVTGHDHNFFWYFRFNIDVVFKTECPLENI